MAASSDQTKEPFSVRQFLQEWESVIDVKTVTENPEDMFKEYAMEKTKLSEEMVEELTTVCNPKTLTCDGEPTVLNNLLKEVPSGLDLFTTSLQKKELQLRKESVTHKCQHVSNMKYKDHQGPWVHFTSKNSDPNDNKKAVGIPEVLLSVQIYRPYKPKSSGIPQLLQEFDVLGHQKLTELRDHIDCIADHMIVGEYSDTPTMQQDVRAKDMFKSGYFFIEGVFYNDMRDPNCRDYSKTIMEWAKDPGRGYRSLQSRKMEENTFLDLSVRIGQPYLYTHQGDCEHVIIFSDIRLVQPDDCQDYAKYPILTQQSHSRKIKCRVCQAHVSSWMTFGSIVTPEDPCFFCETCFRMLHYDQQGNRTVEGFKAYRYPSVPSSKTLPIRP